MCLGFRPSRTPLRAKLPTPRTAAGHLHKNCFGDDADDDDDEDDDDGGGDDGHDADDDDDHHHHHQDFSVDGDIYRLLLMLVAKTTMMLKTAWQMVNSQLILMIT